MRMRMMLMLMMTVVLLLSAGCSESAQETVQEKVQDSVQDEPSDSSSGKTTNNPSFIELSQKEPEGFRIEYEIEYDFDSREGEGRFTQYAGEGGKTRMDYMMEQDGREMEARVYETAEGSTACMKVSGEWNCFTADFEEYTGSTPAEQKTAEQQEEVEKNPEDYDISFEGTRVIAGETAYCFSTELEEQGRTMEHCFLGNGIPAYFESHGPEGSSAMEAVSISQDVSSSDFEFPSEPQDLSEMAGSSVQGQALPENMPSME